jgi:hypothetical protein
MAFWRGLYDAALDALTPREMVFCGVVLLLLLATLWYLLRPTPRTVPAGCTHLAAPTDAGSACSEASPCDVATFLAQAQPGQVLCLSDGVYSSERSMIHPPGGRAGTSTQPITVRALHDGKVTIDAGHWTAAVLLLPGNDWWVIEGLNATGGAESLYRFGGSHGRGRRLIGYHGTSGQDDSNIFRLGGNAVDNVIEDCAAWGQNTRKLFDGAQVSAPGEDAQGSGFRRCWGEFSDFPQGSSNPTNTYQVGYRARNQRYENVLGTWHLTGQAGNPDGIVSAFYDCDSNPDMRGTALLGSLFYVPQGAAFSAGNILATFCSANMRWKDVAAVLGGGFPQIAPIGAIYQPSAGPQLGNVCDNCLSVHNGSPSFFQNNTGWTQVNWHEGNGLAEATGGTSAFTLLPGLCTRYEQGVLTATPLWPWPMAERIKEARMASGYPPVDITAEVERMLGPIPAQCKTGSAPIPPEPIPPGVTSLACTGQITTVPGPLQLRCIPETGGRR